jgi:ABC-2 type transport system permease protein
MTTPPAGVVTELINRGTRLLRRAAAWWALGIVALAVVSVAFWPSLEGNTSLNDLIESSPDLMEAFGAVDLSTAAGYLDGQLYALMLPLLLSAMAVATTSALTSGDEEAGRLELLHALPVGRATIWLSRLAAAVFALAAVTIATAITMVASLGPFSLDDIGVGRILAATFAVAALGVFHAAVTYAVAAATGSRGLAIGVAVGVIVAGYVCSVLLPLSDALEGARYASPWYWAIGTQPVTEGVSAGRIAVLLLVGALVVVAGTLRLGRRDLRVP